MNAVSKYSTHSKMSDDCAGSSASKSPVYQTVNSRLVYRVRFAKHDFISGLGSPIKKGDEIFTPSKPGWASYTKEDMVVARLATGAIIDAKEI